MGREDQVSEQILEHIAKHGVVDKDARRATPRRRPVKAGSGARERRFDAEIDLHGLRREPAAAMLRQTVRRCAERGMKTVLVIHGMGLRSDPAEGPVLKNMVRDMLENELKTVVRAFETAGSRDGGEGATVVRLRAGRD